MKRQVIRHDGIVQSVDGELVYVRILQESACGGCAARQMCNSAEAKEKEVVVRCSAPFAPGQHVVIEGRLSDGRMAAFVAYGMPLLLLLPVLMMGTWLLGEVAGALCSLGVVSLYYLCIYLFFRHSLQSRFEFQLKGST